MVEVERGTASAIPWPFSSYVAFPRPLRRVWECIPALRVPSVALSENHGQLGFLGLVASWSVLPGLPMDSSDAAKWCARRS